MDVNITVKEKMKFIEGILEDLDSAKYNDIYHAFYYFEDPKVKEELRKKYSEAEVRTFGARMSSKL